MDCIKNCIYKKDKYCEFYEKEIINGKRCLSCLNDELNFSKSKTKEDLQKWEKCNYLELNMK